jgi:hypothetical protein
MLVLLSAQGESAPFTLPAAGCPMAHCNSAMSDSTNLPAPSVGRQISIDRRSAGAVGGLGCVSNTRLVACTGGTDPTSGSNLTVYDADGNTVWEGGGLLDATAWFSAAIISESGQVIAADQQRIVRVDPVAGTVVWQSLKPDDGTPISPVLVGSGSDMVLVATKSDAGSGNPELSIWDLDTGALLHHQPIINPVTGTRYQTINTPAVRGNRAYIVAAGVGAPNDARLLAFDICESAACGTRGELQLAWQHPIDGPSSASPVLINDSVFFDGMLNRSTGLMYRVDDLGTQPSQIWRRRFTGRFGASAAADPRGGLWVAPWRSGSLLRVSERDGTVVQTIDVSGVLALSPGYDAVTAMSVSGTDSGPLVLSFGAQQPASVRAPAYLAAIDVSSTEAGVMHWKYQVSRNAARLALTGQSAIVVNESGARRFVLRGTTSSTFFIGEP